jgi:hypothetical protein
MLCTAFFVTFPHYYQYVFYCTWCIENAQVNLYRKWYISLFIHYLYWISHCLRTPQSAEAAHTTLKVKQACYIKCMQTYNIIRKVIKQYACACICMCIPAPVCIHYTANCVSILSVLFKNTVSYYDYVAVVIGERIWSISRMTLTGEHWHTQGKISPSATLSITNSTYTGRGLKPDLCSEMPATNSLNQGMAPDHIIRQYEILWYCTQLTGWNVNSWHFEDSSLLGCYAQSSSTQPLDIC